MSVDPSDEAGIAAALQRLYAERAQAKPGNPEVVARFDRRRLTERLAAIFDEMSGIPAAAGASG